jgi:hypothetical protein
MIKELQYALLALVVAMTLAVLVVAGAAVWALYDVRQDATAAGSLLADARRTVVIVAGAATSVEKSLRAEREASAAQIEASTAALAKFNGDLDELHSDLSELHVVLVKADTVLSDTDLQVNINGAGLAALEKHGAEAISQLQASIAGLAPAIDATNRAMQSVSAVAADPAIPEAIARLDSTTGHIDATTASVDRDAQLVEARLRQALKPASLAKSLFMRLLGIAGPAAQIATAAK